MRFLFSVLAAVTALFFAVSSSSSIECVEYTTPIKNVVVVMFENRAFDHLLGYLKKVNPAIDGVNGNEVFPVNCTDPNSGTVPVHDGAPNFQDDPDHSFDATYNQIFGYGQPTDPAPMTGFYEQGVEHFNGNLTSGNILTALFIFGN